MPLDRENNFETKIPIGISSCLLGEQVRYDGGHKLNHNITDVLSEYFEFISFCPEVAIGLGVPRPSIRLLSPPNAPRAVLTGNEKREVTYELDSYGKKIADSMTNICGYIFKSNSPSCGTEYVKVYDDSGHPAGMSAGIYAKAIMKNQPLLPIAEDDDLNDPGLIINFIDRVSVYHHWLCLINIGLSTSNLREFHTEHKSLIVTRDLETMGQLECLIANVKEDIEKTAMEYIKQLMKTLRPPPRGEVHGCAE